MNKLAHICLYTSSILMFIGGLGDQFINEYLAVHRSYLGTTSDLDFFNNAQSLSMLMLHSAGGGLMCAGISMFTLTHFAVRKNQKWALYTLLVIALIAQGINGYGMYSAGSHYWYPLLVLITAIIGFVFKLQTMKKDI